MAAYIIVAIFPILVGCIFDNTTKGMSANKLGRRRWFALFIAALPMFVLIGFRNQTIGSDTAAYIYYFCGIDKLDWKYIFDATTMEPGYILFTKLIGVFTDSPLVYQVCCAMVYCIAVTTFANQLERSHFAFLYFFATLGVYTFMFTGTRQSLALSICLLSYVFIKKRKILPFSIIIAIAFFFHKSSILFAVAYIVYSMPFGIFSVLLYALMALLLYFNIGVVQEWFNDQLNYDYGVESTNSGLLFLAIVFLITVFAIFTIYGYRRESKESVGALNISMIALVFWVVRLATRVAERPSYYFLVFTMVILAYGINSINIRDQRIIIGIIIGVFCMAMYMYRFTTNYQSYVPYMFYSLNFWG